MIKSELFQVFNIVCPCLTQKIKLIFSENIENKMICSFSTDALNVCTKHMCNSYVKKSKKGKKTKKKSTLRFYTELSQIQSLL